MNWFNFFRPKSQNLLAVCPIPIIIITRAGDITFANKEALTLFGTNTLRKKNLLSYLKDNSSYLEDFMEESTIIKIVNELDEEKLLLVKAVPVNNETRLMLTFSDVSETTKNIDSLVSENEYFKKNQTEKENFIIKMSNNILSPIHSIVGFSQAILEGLGGEVSIQQEKYLSIINKNSSELLTTLERLVQMVVLDSGQYKFEIKNFDIVSLINVVVNQSKAKLDSKKIDIVIDTEGLISQNCYTDENAVKNVLGNLLENAIQSCDFGKIKVHVENLSTEFIVDNKIKMPIYEDDYAYILLSIEDNGNGVAKEDLTDIFNPYIQVDKNSKKNLFKSILFAVTKKLVEGMEGRIWFQSEVMKGSTFTIILPVKRNQQPSEFADRMIIKKEENVQEIESEEQDYTECIEEFEKDV